MPYPDWSREGTGGGAGVDPQTATNTVNIASNLAAITSAQTDLDAAELSLAQATADIAAINADNATQTELDAVVTAQAAVDAAQDTLASARQAAQDAMRSDLDMLIANVGETVAVGGRVIPLDDPRPYINNTAAAIVLTGDDVAAVTGDGLVLDVATGDNYANANLSTTGNVTHTFNHDVVQTGSGAKQIQSDDLTNSGDVQSNASLGFSRITMTSAGGTVGSSVASLSDGLVEIASTEGDYKFGVGATPLLPIDKTAETTKNLVVDTATGRLLSAPDSALASVQVDAGAGAFLSTLPATTSSGVVQLYTNIDVTNSATLAVQSGETLNGVVDGSFLFSNYSIGTQFRVDEVTGGWVVSVVGASTVTPVALDRVLVRLSTEYSNSSGDNTWQVVPFDVAEYDPNGNFNAGANSYVVPENGDYRTDVVLTYNNNGATSNDAITVGIRKNGSSEILRLQHDLSDQITSNGWLPITLSGVLPGLVAGDIITVEQFDADDIIQIEQDNSHWSIEQLPISTVVMPDALDIEDTRVLLGSGTGLVSNDTVSISETWGNLAATYEKVEFELITTAGSLNIKQNASISTANWTDDTRTVFYSDAATDTAVIRDMDIAGSTANLFLSGGATTTATVNVYGVKPQKTVINTVDTPTDDQSVSGYFDIGNMRVQWGRGTTSGGIVAVTLPQPYVDTSYSINLTAANGTNVTMMYNADTTTGFQAVARDPGGSAINTSFSWIATGVKP